MDSLPKSERLAYEAAHAALEACVEELYAQAVEVADEYMRKVDAVEATAKSWGDRSTLQLSCARQGNHLDLKWTGVKWYGPKNNRTSKRFSIEKTKESFGYTKSKIRAFAKDWELDVAMQTEEKLTLIRRKAGHIAKALVSLHNLDRLIKANSNQSVSGDESEQEED